MNRIPANSKYKVFKYINSILVHKGNLVNAVYGQHCGVLFSG